MMLEELQRRNYSTITTRNYLRVVADFAKYFGNSPDKLGPNELRTYQAYLLTERKLISSHSWPLLRRSRAHCVWGRSEDLTQQWWKDCIALGQKSSIPFETRDSSESTRHSRVSQYR